MGRCKESGGHQSRRMHPHFFQAKTWCFKTLLVSQPDSKSSPVSAAMNLCQRRSCAGCRSAIADDLNQLIGFAPGEGLVRWLAQLWPDFRIYPGSVAA